MTGRVLLARTSIGNSWSDKGVKKAGNNNEDNNNILRDLFKNKFK